jgi:hypothetical protein
MSKPDENYMIITWTVDDGGDYGKPTLETWIEYVTDKELDDLASLMKIHGVKHWVDNPKDMTLEKFKYGDGALIEYRNLQVKPIKVVKSWGVFRDRVNES